MSAANIVDQKSQKRKTVRKHIVFTAFFKTTGVVVIDDQPEVTIDDPNFLYENNDGFQEVQSKKAKSKLKAAEAETKKQIATEIQETVPAKKKDVISKVG